MSQSKISRRTHEVRPVVRRTRPLVRSLRQGYINERDTAVSDEPLFYGVSLFRAVYGGLSTNYYFEVRMLKKQTHLGSKYFVNAFIFIAIFVLQAHS